LPGRMAYIKADIAKQHTEMRELRDELRRK
jgi:hypothetical protein